MNVLLNEVNHSELKPTGSVVGADAGVDGVRLKSVDKNDIVVGWLGWPARTWVLAWWVRI